MSTEPRTSTVSGRILTQLVMDVGSGDGRLGRRYDDLIQPSDYIAGGIEAGDGGFLVSVDHQCASVIEGSTYSGGETILRHTAQGGVTDIKLHGSRVILQNPQLTRFDPQSIRLGLKGPDAALV